MGPSAEHGESRPPGGQPQLHEPLWRPWCQWSWQAVPEPVWSWLLDTASLTQRLRQTCAGEFSVDVLRQCWMRPMRNETRLLGVAPSRNALVREVRLLCAGEPWVFARTVIPRSTFSGKERRLAYLGSRPLGAYLFADPSMRRAALEIARIGPHHRLYHAALGHSRSAASAIWGRRSVFLLHDKPVLVSELFLPNVPAPAGRCRRAPGVQGRCRR